jgi:hypothetical protein
MRRKSESILLALSGAVVLAALVISGAARAGHLDDDYATDSQITLIEKSGTETLTISIATNGSRTSLVSDRSGSLKAVDVDEAACSQLWTDLLALPIDELESATPKAAFPDSSEFTLVLRVGSSSHRLTVYDVDSLEDQRYRSAIRAILDLERGLLSKPAGN